MPTGFERLVEKFRSADSAGKRAISRNGMQRVLLLLADGCISFTSHATPVSEIPSFTATAISLLHFPAVRSAMQNINQNVWLPEVSLP